MARAELIASNRTAGASELLSDLLPLLDEALAAGRETTLAVARVVCMGQPAMAPLWNACALAARDLVTPGTFARGRAEFERAPRALVRAASAALCDALAGGGARQLLTLSYSSAVSHTLQAVGVEGDLEVVCAESLPAGEGVRLRAELQAAGVRTQLVLDAELTTYLPSADAVIVGADAIAAREWTNKAGTFGLAAAAWFCGVPVYVVASRDKAQPDALAGRVPLPRTFERIPVSLATLFLTDAGAVPPDDVPSLSERFAAAGAELVHLIGWP